MYIVTKYTYIIENHTWARQPTPQHLTTKLLHLQITNVFNKQITNTISIQHAVQTDTSKLHATTIQLTTLKLGNASFELELCRCVV